MGLLFDVFGRSLAEKGRLRTKYIAPIFENQLVTAAARVTARSDTADGDTVYTLDVWCEDDAGKRLTVGEAVVHATRG
jgi:hypothetical protein